jgi:hypothetical protein
MRPKHRGPRPKRAGPTRGPAQLSLRGFELCYDGRLVQSALMDYIACLGMSCSAADPAMPAAATAAAADIFPNVTTPACRARFRS